MQNKCRPVVVLSFAPRSWLSPLCAQAPSCTPLLKPCDWWSWSASWMTSWELKKDWDWTGCPHQLNPEIPRHTFHIAPSYSHSSGRNDRTRSIKRSMNNRAMTIFCSSPEEIVLVLLAVVAWKKGFNSFICCYCFGAAPNSAQGSLPMELEGSYMVLGIAPSLTACKASALPPTIFLTPGLNLTH